jgi:hypothetical protein
MKNVLFGTIVVLSTILTSCGSATSTEETTTEDSTAVTAPVVDTVQVDSSKVEK